MKKYIFVLDAIKLLAMLADGKRIEGVLYMDEYGKPTFKPYYRKTPKCHHKDKLVHSAETVKDETEICLMDLIKKENNGSLSVIADQIECVEYG